MPSHTMGLGRPGRGRRHQDALIVRATHFHRGTPSNRRGAIRLFLLRLVPKPVVNLVDSMFSDVGSVDSLGVIVGDACFLGGPRDGEGLLVNEADELGPLSV